MAGIQLRSHAFHDHDLMPERFSRPGGNTSPPLEWSGMPHDTEEVVLLCEDPDAPDGTCLHWLVTGIDPTASGVPEGNQPPGGLEWHNDFGEIGYSGPQPPPGDEPHRYFFRLYAVREPLKLPRHPNADDVHRALEGRELASGTLVGRFGR